MLKTLQNLKINKSPGPEVLHPAFLKELAPQLRKQLLTIIFNNSIKTDKLPTDWKKAQITALCPPIVWKQ